MRISEALATLDPQDSEHWTEDGAPLLEVIGKLVEAPITREAVLEIAPLFTRLNPQLEEEVPPPDEDPEVKITKPEESKPADKSVEKSIPDHIQTVMDIKVFRKSQREQRMTRALARAELKEKIGPIGNIGRSPLDEAMAHKRGRGTRRPVVPPK